MSLYRVCQADKIKEVEWAQDSPPSGAELCRLAGLAAKGPGRPLAFRQNGEIFDLSAPAAGPEISPVSAADPEGLNLLRHSVAHIMAEAVIRLFPRTKVAIGPSIEDGFYYDFDKPEPFTPEDLGLIAKEMETICGQAQVFERREESIESALDFFREKEEVYKAELIEDLAKTGEKTVSFYRCGDFTDLCRGPHIPDTSSAGAFKLLSVAGAYWRGDSSRPMLQRIYGTAFFTPKELRVHLDLLEEAKKRDHRKLGRELDLFSLHEEIGGGLVVWHPKGALLRSILENFERNEHLRRGYEAVMGPQILRADLWQKSGHLDYYRENMYFTEADGQPYAIKPMNCLAHMFIYKSHLRSFRDLPLRLFELGTVQRQEKSGVLHGLTRVRQFTQDDAHIFCTPAQVDSEIKDVLKLVSDMMDAFGFDFEMELSTRPEKSIGSDADWEMATRALTEALASTGRAYEINHGDGAFYGPKIDVKLKDALNRRWQCATIQCDFTLPERFDLTFTDTDNQKKRPVMLHRTVFGSLERFIGVLIEHFAGDFPLWLAPVQAVLLTVTSRADQAAGSFLQKLKKLGIRAQTDLRNEKLGYKIREAQLAKIPYILVFGDKEAENGTAAVRRRGQELGPMTMEGFTGLIAPEAKAPVWERQGVLSS
ncbi:MAG: threonine--tRNA ligase [Deltaproteobacteria bacterium]|jgi:threonyl-tRNA synthetase|nr:threonine--tRNA ligase [Deltaproteobacteria bacterium]